MKRDSNMNTPKYWGKTIASFLLVLFTMPLGHALMRVMEDTMTVTALHYSAFAMGAVGLAIVVIRAAKGKRMSQN